MLAPFEHIIIDAMLERVPVSIRCEHLTLMTVLWSAAALITSALARQSVRWLWATSLIIACQYVTDCLDGKVGVQRNAGLAEWSYYMDHLLDYVFLCSLLIGYSTLLPSHLQFLMLPMLSIAGGFMVSSFLACHVTGELRISFIGIGPAEVRLTFIAINTLLATYGQPYMVRTIPYIIIAAFVALAALVIQTQRDLWTAHKRRQMSEQGQEVAAGIVRLQ
ncbi:MAG TPA: CDP-alcohol phosphatidyltransferase family protein [Vicinamibacterales bacterium]|nr:CDP-alcohol phosphatidyltransferase family protein [Vicinamibacterales bacterium]